MNQIAEEIGRVCQISRVVESNARSEGKKGGVKGRLLSDSVNAPKV